MVQAAKSALPDANPEHVSDATSGLVTSYFFLGEIVGPPLGGFLEEHLGFENGAAAVTGIVLCYILVFGLVGGSCSECWMCFTGQRQVPDGKLKETLTGEEEMVMTSVQRTKEEELV